MHRDSGFGICKQQQHDIRTAQPKTKMERRHSIDGRRLTVTYCDEYGLWPQLADELSSRLPLRNLHWKSASPNRPLRTIQLLDIDLKRFNTDPAPQHMMVLQQPYMNLYFVTCDDNETYRNTVKKQIRTWLDAVQLKKHQEWLICYVANRDGKNSKSFLNVRGTIFDKIKADFNNGKKDRCCNLRIHDTNDNGIDNNEVWADFLSKMKDGILNSFDMHVLQYEEDIQRLDSQRQMPGWNYCTFFILKEGLAQAFESMILFDDALIQYDELEQTFYQILEDKALAWFGHFGGTDPEDDSGNILDYRKKSYRDSIIKNTITVFDFRSYLFARQCNMLTRLHRPIEIFRRTRRFVSRFSEDLRQNEEQLPKSFCESWVFSACTTVVNECDQMQVVQTNQDPNFLFAYNIIRGELLYKARKQLDIIGILYNMLPATLPFSIYLPRKREPSRFTEQEDRKMFGSPVLREAIESPETFENIYVLNSAKAIQSYESCNRPGIALQIHGDVASLKHHMQKYEEASLIFESMTWRYGEQGWNLIENVLLVKCADCQKHLSQTKNYLISCLTLLTNLHNLSYEEADFYSQELVNFSKTLEEDITRQFAPMFSVTVCTVIDGIENEEKGNAIEVLVHNKLPRDMTFDTMALRLLGTDTEELWFQVENQLLTPGLNTIRLHCELSTAGNYVVETFKMNLGKLDFTHNFLHGTNKKRIFTLNQDPNVLSINISQPMHVSLGETQYFSVRLFSSKAAIKEGVLSVRAVSEDLMFLKMPSFTAQICDGNQDTIIDSSTATIVELTVYDDGRIALPSLSKNQVMQVFLPYEGLWGQTEFKVQIFAGYTTVNGKYRSFAATEVIKVDMPLSVSETTVFREDCVFFKVELSCNGTIPVRISRSSLKPSKVYDVASFSDVENWALTLFPRQLASFVYKLTKRDAGSKDTGDLNNMVHFVIKYRRLKEEIEYRIKSMVTARLEAEQLGQHAQLLIEHIKEIYLSSIDYYSYALRDIILLPDFDDRQCLNLLLHYDPQTRQRLTDILKEFLKDNRQLTKETVFNEQPPLPEAVVSFPLDVPTSKVLHTVELILDTSEHFIVTEACPCKLKIQQSSYWTAEHRMEIPNEFYYDVEVDYDNWLLEGRRKQTFTKADQALEFPLTLVPLKTGRLLLPSIRVSSVSPNVFAATVYVNNAQQVLVKQRTRPEATFFVEPQTRTQTQPQAPLTGTSREAEVGRGEGSAGYRVVVSGLANIREETVSE